MKFKKVDILISENLTKEQLKVKVLQELNKVAQNDGYDALSIHYIANIHDIRNGKYWICMDTETKNFVGADDELIDLQSIFKHTIKDPNLASEDLLYSSKYIEENFTRLLAFLEYKTTNDARVSTIEGNVAANELDIEDKHTRLTNRVSSLEEYKVNNTNELQALKNLHLLFKKDTENNINAINNALSAKADLQGSETEIFRAAPPINEYDVINKKYLEEHSLTEETATAIKKHIINYNNPHETSIRNLSDVILVSEDNGHVLEYSKNDQKFRNVNLNNRYYQKTEIDTKLRDVNTTITNLNTKYYQKTEIDTKLRDVNRAITDLESDVNTTIANLGTKYYQKNEIETKLTEIKNNFNRIIGNLNDLKTASKASVVGAINELLDSAALTKSTILTQGVDYNIIETPASESNFGRYKIIFLKHFGSGLIATNNDGENVELLIKWNLGDVPFIECCYLDIQNIKLITAVVDNSGGTPFPPASRILVKDVDYTVNNAGGNFEFNLITEINNGIMGLDANGDEVLLQCSWDLTSIPKVTKVLSTYENIKLIAIAGGFNESINTSLARANLSRTSNYETIATLNDYSVFNYNNNNVSKIRVNKNISINFESAPENIYSKKQLIVENYSSAKTININFINVTSEISSLSPLQKIIFEVEFIDGIILLKLIYNSI